MASTSPRIAVIIAAAGSSTRMGAGIDKQFVSLAGRPLLWYSVQCFSSMPEVRQLLVTVSASNEKRVAALLRDNAAHIPWKVVPGGSERQDSVRKALLLTIEDADLVLVHDGARPFVDQEMVRLSLEPALECGASVVAVPVKDTIKSADSHSVVRKTLDRRNLWQIQTPQTFRREVLLNAHLQAAAAGFLATDDAALVEWTGGSVRIVRGSYKNLKVTTPEDVVFAESLAAEGRKPKMQRVGIGYDVHRFAPMRPLVLGGVPVPYPLGLEGHSDADALLHAISDAMLGAAGLGDIGRHFPDTESRYKGISSLVLLREVNDKVGQAGYVVCNVDAVIEAQEPKLAPFIGQMNASIARTLNLSASQVNVKATTTEGLGFVGRKEGIAAHAVVMIGYK